VTETTELSTMARGVQRLWWLIASLGLLGGVIAVTVTSRMTPIYEATTSIIVGDALQASPVETRALKASETVAQAYADIIPRRPIMEGVVTTLNLRSTWQQVAKQVNVERPADDPQLIVVTVDATTPQRAEAIAATVADQLIALSSSRAAAERRSFVEGQLAGLQRKLQAADAQLADLQKQQAAAATPVARQTLQKQIDATEKAMADWQRNYADLAALRPPDSTSTSVEILEKAHASPVPVSPQTNRIVLLAVALGIMIAVPLVYLLERRRVFRRDEKARQPEPDSSAMPLTRRRSPGRPAAATRPRSPLVAGRKRVRA
jgi:capsular polysaccharide biosynthesis protein